MIGYCSPKREVSLFFVHAFEFSRFAIINPVIEEKARANAAAPEHRWVTPGPNHTLPMLRVRLSEAQTYLARKSVTNLMVACGFSSMIQCPELGTMPPVTLLATNCI